MYIFVFLYFVLSSARLPVAQVYGTELCCVWITVGNMLAVAAPTSNPISKRTAWSPSPATNHEVETTKI